MLFSYRISFLRSSGSVGFPSKVFMALLGVQVPVAPCNDKGNEDGCQLQKGTQDKVVVPACKSPKHLNVHLKTIISTLLSNISQKIYWI